MFFILNFDSQSVEQSQIKVASISPTIKPSPVPTIPQNQVINQEIIKVEGDEKIETGIFFYDGEAESGYNNSIERWEDWLIQFTQEYYLSKSEGAYLGASAPVYTKFKIIQGVHVFNTETNEQFDIPLAKKIDGEIWSATAQILDNKYLFGFGGAYGANIEYELTLPPRKNSQIVKYSDTAGNYIGHFGNIYLTSFCYEGCVYSLFNPKTHKLTRLERMNAASNGYDQEKSEEAVGVDSQGRLIITIKDDDKKLSLAAVPLWDEKQTIILAESEQLPQDSQFFYMADGSDKIVIQGNSLYLFDLKSIKYQEFSMSQKFKEDELEYIRSNYGQIWLKIRKGKIYSCVGNMQDDLNSRYTIDLESVSVIDGYDESCLLDDNATYKSEGDLQLDKQAWLEAQLKKFDLDPNKFIVEERVIQLQSKTD